MTCTRQRLAVMLFGIIWGEMDFNNSARREWPVVLTTAHELRMQQLRISQQAAFCRRMGIYAKEF